MYKILFSPIALKQAAKLQKSGSPAYQKLARILPELEAHPRHGEGRPERLRHMGDAEEWSRRLDKKNRLTYTIDDTLIVVEILTTIGHYDDK